MGSRQMLQSSSHVLMAVVNVTRSSQRLSSLGAGKIDMVVVLKGKVVCVCVCVMCEQEGSGRFLI